MAAAEATMMMTAAAHPKAEKTSGMSHKPHPRVSDSSTASVCGLVHDFCAMFGNGDIGNGIFAVLIHESPAQEASERRSACDA